MSEWEMGSLRERLATLAHEQWSGWMMYMFNECTRNEDGTVTVPAWAVERWQRQMTTPYRQLPEDERESDRRQADRVLAIVRQLVRRLGLA